MPLGGSLTSTSKPASERRDHLQLNYIKDSGSLSIMKAFNYLKMHYVMSLDGD